MEHAMDLHARLDPKSALIGVIGLGIARRMGGAEGMITSTAHAFSAGLPPAAGRHNPK